MKVQNLVKNGRAVANQFVITDGNGIIEMQSYNSLVCRVDKVNNRITFGKDWCCSNTTRKNLYHFLSTYAGMCVLGEDVKKMIASGKSYDGRYIIVYDETL